MANRYTLTNEQRQQQVQDLTQQLEEGVKSVFELEKYAQYLKVMSHFTHYSVNNTILIAMQTGGQVYMVASTAFIGDGRGGVLGNLQQETEDQIARSMLYLSFAFQLCPRLYSIFSLYDFAFCPVGMDSSRPYSRQMRLLSLQIL